MRVHLESRSGASGKFWRLAVSGTELEVRFGKIGTEGQARLKSFASAKEAREAAEQLVAEKRRKGYVDAGSPAKKKRVSRELKQLDWPDAAGNAFERLVVLSEDQIHNLELRACLTNARELQPDGGGNIWHTHVSPRDGSEWVFCVDHETGHIFGNIYPAEVFGELYPSELLDEAYEDEHGDLDERKVRALYREKVPHLSRRDETKTSELIHALWERTDWLVELLYGEAEGGTPPPDEALAKELALPEFRNLPCSALYWLLRAFFLDDAAALARVLPEAKQSDLAVIRDAARAIEQFQQGRGTSLGPVEDVLAVRAAFLARQTRGTAKARKAAARSR
jgi:predicted DNA-binding WGR domain protein